MRVLQQNMQVVELRSANSTGMSQFRIAAYQMNVGNDVEANFVKIGEAIKQAASSDAQIVVFPECALSGYPPIHYPDVNSIDTVRISQLNNDICRLARDAAIWVVLGTITVGREGLLNSALVISSDGKLVGRYDKLHLMPQDKQFFVPGEGVPIFRADDIVFGVQICYDARFPEAFRYLREQGAQLIVIISNACGGETWKLPVLEGTYRTRASENSCFIAAVNAAGPLQMATSRICNPLGLDLASANQDREEIIFADIDISETKSGYFYDRRTDQFEVRPKWFDGSSSP